MSPSSFRNSSAPVNIMEKPFGVDEFSLEGTIAEGDAIYSEMRRDALSPDPLTEVYFEELGGEHEQVVEIIYSVGGTSSRRFFANLPNGGQVRNLPLGAVVETPAIADANGIHPIMQTPLPTAAAGVLASRFAWVDVVVEAALEGSRTKICRCPDPGWGGKVSGYGGCPGG